jgi:hypothetical protein
MYHILDFFYIVGFDSEKRRREAVWLSVPSDDVANPQSLSTHSDIKLSIVIIIQYLRISSFYLSHTRH